MSKRNHCHRKSSSRGKRRAIAVAVALLATALVTGGCGQEKEEVCSGKPEHLIVVPSTSETDYDVSVAITPDVSRQAVRRVAASCGRLTVGIQDGRPEANLALRSTTLVPKDKTAFNPGAKTDVLVEEGDEFVDTNLIAPLSASPATGGSPFLSTLGKIGEELVAHDWEQGTIVLVGDGLVVERPPGGGAMIRFGAEPVSAEAVAPFVPLLKRLHGSCVILVGAGATSKLPDGRIRTSQELLGETLERAGVGFVATRSPDLPGDC